MSALAIARLQLRMRSTRPVPERQSAAWRDALARLDGDALAGRWVGADEWLLIRRLAVRLSWHANAAPGDVGRCWRDALTQAIDGALADGDAACVRYPNRRAALADLIYRSARGDLSRQWAWERMGLLERSGLDGQETLRAGAQQLLHTPELVWPLLMRWLLGEAQCAAFSAVLGAVPGAVWRQWLAASPRSAPYAQPGVAARAQAAPASVPPATGLQAPQARTLLQWAHGHPALARQHGETLVPLLAAIEWPAPGLPAAAVRQRLAWAWRLLAPVPAGSTTAAGPAVADPASAPAEGPGATPSAAPPDGTTRVERADDRPSPAAPASVVVLRRTQATPPLPALPEPPGLADGLLTAHGGALFWLPRLGASTALRALWEPSGVHSDALALLLRETVSALGVPLTDPVAAVFCGGRVPEAPAPAACVEQARALVAGWEAWLAEAAPDLPPARVQAVCRRRGRLLVEPGWVELHLALDQVDTRVRRLGLDLDPGWLPWLACVVRICYDDA